LMLAELCEFVIIGHSERRQYFSETDEIVNRKLRAALKVGLKPILCVGERLEENEAGRTEEVVSQQLKSSLAGIEYGGSLIVAYEPVWAIGTGRSASPSEISDLIASVIRPSLAGIWGEKISQGIRVLYGGSVNPGNAGSYLNQTEIDGALVGGASLLVENFLGILEKTQ
ncbi:MAG: triose-phosphate isomerase, partial [Anaerolineales bacterium]|nr:triose-phosphate isomerase [Anaerolineales bacterium]